MQGEYEGNCTTSKIMYGNTSISQTVNTVQHDSIVTLVQCPLVVFINLSYFE
jgi:hypothetical protein